MIVGWAARGGAAFPPIPALADRRRASTQAPLCGNARGGGSCRHLVDVPALALCPRRGNPQGVSSTDVIGPAAGCEADRVAGEPRFARSPSPSAQSSRRRKIACRSFSSSATMRAPLSSVRSRCSTVVVGSAFGDVRGRDRRTEGCGYQAISGDRSPCGRFPPGRPRTRLARRAGTTRGRRALRESSALRPVRRQRPCCCALPDARRR